MWLIQTDVQPLNCAHLPREEVNWFKIKVSLFNLMKPFLISDTCQVNCVKKKLNQTKTYKNIFRMTPVVRWCSLIATIFSTALEWFHRESLVQQITRGSIPESLNTWTGLRKILPIQFTVSDKMSTHKSCINRCRYFYLSLYSIRL